GRGLLRGRGLRRRALGRGGLLGGGLLGRRRLLGRGLLRRGGLLGRGLLRRCLLGRRLLRRGGLLGRGLLRRCLLGRSLLRRCHPFLLCRLLWYGIGARAIRHEIWHGQVDAPAGSVERVDHELVALPGGEDLSGAPRRRVAEVLERQVAAGAVREDVGAVGGEALDLTGDGRADRVCTDELDERE